MIKQTQPEEPTLTNAAAVRAARRLRGITLQQLADASGMHYGKVFRIEHGRVTPTEDELKAIWIALVST